MKTIIIIIICFWPQAQAIIGYDCTDPSSEIVAVSLMTEPECRKTNNSIDTDDVLVQVLQRKKFDHVQYTQCLVSYHVVITHCRPHWWNSNMHAISYNYIVPITKERCKEMHSYLKYHDPMFTGLFLNIINDRADYSGTIVGNNHEGACKGGTFTAHKQNIGKFEDVHVSINIDVRINRGKASLDLKQKKISLESGAHAPYDDEQLFDSIFGHTFWNTDIDPADCESNMFIIWQGTATKTRERLIDNSTRTSYVVANKNEERSFFLEAFHNTYICGEKVFTTQAIPIFIVESNNGIFSNKLQKDLNARNFDGELFLSLKISHLAYNIGDQITELYNLWQYENCLIRSKILMNSLALARVEPQLWAVSTFGLGYHGTIRSEAIFVQRCLASNISHRSTPECFNELPITFDEKPMFMTPRSRLIVSNGEQIPCSSILGNKYKLDNHWYERINGQLIRTKPPIDLSHSPTIKWKYSTLSDIANSGIYNKEEIDQFKSVLYAPLNLQAQVSNFMGSLTGEHDLPSHMSISNVFTMDDFNRICKEIQTSVWNKLMFYMHKLGDWVSCLIGIMIVFKIIKFIANTIMNVLVISHVFGCSPKIVFAIWDHLVNITLHKQSNKTKKTNDDQENA